MKKVKPESIAIPKIKYVISFRLLLAIYAIIPICFGAFLLDKYWFDEYLKYTLRISPESYFWLSLLFGTPHIIASNLIFFGNKDYVQKYWKHAVAMTAIIIAFFAVTTQFLSYNALFAIIASVTILHVVKQQIGIGNAVARLKGPMFNLWTWSVIGSGIVLYNALYLRRIFTPEQTILLNQTLMALSIITIALAIVNHQRIKNTLGKAFLWANTIMAVSSYFFFNEQYYFFAVLGPRFIHDVSAFVFYSVHDGNRHGVVAQNKLYRVFNKLHIHAFLAVPLSAIIITFIFQKYGDDAISAVTMALFNTHIPQAMTLGFIGYLSLMHYFTEAFTWKGLSPYKKYIGFKAVN